MNIADILTLKYPNANFRVGGDIVLQDDGDGVVYIAQWDMNTPQPTEKELAQWAIDLEPLYVKQQKEIINKPIIQQLEEIDAKSIRALRTNDIGRLQSLEEQAVELRKQLI